MSDTSDEIRAEMIGMRRSAQSAFGLGVEGIISELRRFAAAAEGAIGEISIDEAFQGVARVVAERVAQLTDTPFPASSAVAPERQETIWECGCGAINGVNLATCGRCARARADSEYMQPVQPVSDPFAGLRTRLEIIAENAEKTGNLCCHLSGLHSGEQCRADCAASLREAAAALDPARERT